jgi:hypothetical protein
MDTDAEIHAMKPRSSMPIVFAALIGLLLGGAAGAGAMMQFGPDFGKKKRTRTEAPARSAAPAASATASAAASASAAPSGSALPMSEPTPFLPAPAKNTLAGRAAQGDADAAKQIEGRPMDQRTLDEAMGLASSRVQIKRKEIGELKRKITLLPKLVSEDKSVLTRLKELANDRDVSVDTLAMFASLEGPLGPDLLYNVASSRTTTETTKLAEELSYAKEVRFKASEALGAVLDLKKTDKCEEAAKILERVKLRSDRRALVPLAKLSEKRGCGEKKTEDCWKCLREGDLLKDTQAEVKKRKAPF